MTFISRALLFLLVFSSTNVAATDRPESICYGTAEKGRIENAWQLPASGENFSAYSRAGVLTGRNYIHSKVYAIILDAYKELERQQPGKKFVYGETGWKTGGRFRPHKTHQNGLSVDFFVPVLDKNGKSVPLPANLFNKFGYAIEFDSHGKYKNYAIDFDAMAAHLTALKEAADRHGIKILRVIFETDLQGHLFKTPDGEKLQSLMTFSKKPSWVRHDEHYHVDFDVQCKGFR